MCNSITVDGTWENRNYRLELLVFPQNGNGHFTVITNTTVFPLVDWIAYKDIFGRSKGHINKYIHGFESIFLQEIYKLN